LSKGGWAKAMMGAGQERGIPGITLVMPSAYVQGGASAEYWAVDGAL